MPSLALDGVDLHYELDGALPTSGAPGSAPPPLVMIAGLGSDSRSWLPVVDALAASRPLIRPDNRGVGRTRPLAAAPDLATMVADLTALLDALGCAPYDVVGHSMGGRIALELAVTRPDLVRRLIVAASFDGVLPKTAQLMADLATLRVTPGIDRALWFRLLFQFLFHPRLFVDPAALAAAVAASVEDPLPQPDAAFAAQVAVIGSAEPLGERLEGLRCPTLILYGRYDLLISGHDSVNSLGAIPNLRAAQLDHAAHALHWDDAPGFVREVTAFLDN